MVKPIKFVQKMQTGASDPLEPLIFSKCNPLPKRYLLCKLHHWKAASLKLAHFLSFYELAQATF